MTYETIKDLLEKYFAGETGLEEEKILRGYFLSQNVDKRLARYAPLFQFFDAEETVELSAEASEKLLPKTQLQVAKSPLRTSYIVRRTLLYAAAIALLVVGSGILFKTFWQTEPTDRLANRKAKIIVFDENTVNNDPEKALAEIEKALMKTSKKMKKGTDEAAEGLSKVKKASEILDK